jgi:hypothetical protein
MSINIRTVNKHLKERDLRASRDKRGIHVEGAGLRYTLDPSKFSDASDLAAAAASRIPLNTPRR